MFDVVSTTLAPLRPALAWVLNVSHRVVGQWPTYRRNRRSGTSGWCTGAGGPCYVLRRVRRSTQLRRRRPAMPCRVRTQDGPVGLVKRLEGGGRMNGATMEPGYTLILQASSRQLPHVRVRIPKPPPETPGSESESILEFSSVIFSRRFSLTEGHSHLSLLLPGTPMRNSQECQESTMGCDAGAGLRAAVMSAKGKSAGVSETSFCGLQRGRSGLVGGGRGGGRNWTEKGNSHT